MSDEQGALLPCPFCGGELSMRLHSAFHPKNVCWLSEYELDDSDFAAWNNRAVPDLRPGGHLEKVGWFFSSILNQPHWPDVDDLLKLCYQRAIESSSAPLGELLIAYCRSRDRADSLVSLVAELVEALEEAFAFMQRKLGVGGSVALQKDYERFTRVRVALARAREVKP